MFCRTRGRQLHKTRAPTQDASGYMRIGLKKAIDKPSNFTDCSCNQNLNQTTRSMATAELSYALESDCVQVLVMVAPVTRYAQPIWEMPSAVHTAKASITCWKRLPKIRNWASELTRAHRENRLHRICSERVTTVIEMRSVLEMQCNERLTSSQVYMPS